MSANDDFINVDDFKTSTVTLDLTNTTTRTEIKDGKRIFGDHAQKVENLPAELQPRILEFHENALTLEVPKHTCAQGHNVTLEAKLKLIKGEKKFSASGKVTEISNVGDRTDSIHIKFLQLEERQWLEFQQYFSNRQNDILKFFEAVKG